MPILPKEFSDMVIALVDDDPDDRFIIRRSLNYIPQRISIVEYEDGRECLDAFLNSAAQNEHPAEMIVLDLNMPRMNGQEFLKAFRADRRFANVPIVVLTTADDAETLQSVLDLGANASMSKSGDWNTRGALSQFISDCWMDGPFDFDEPLLVKA
ncbi:MAG: hypothetical protein COA52_03570 [Hyphomicrobiales bacterium]|nr:MAG: hypothetical protein COA52_03570 [Hyphomicrobiales bacterium]